MQADENCKGCSGNVRLEEDEIKKIFSETIKARNFKLVSEEVYRERLDQCSKCRYFEYGTTCRQCGCLVQIKAKLAAAKCPFPQDSKW